MRVLDLCSGTGSATQAFRDAGHDVLHLELDASFHPELCMDVLAFAKKPHTFLPPNWRPDVVWASPPCTVFSMAGSGKGKERWLDLLNPHPIYGKRYPATDEALLGCEIVMACLEAIRVLAPRFWWLENPQGGLQTMGFMADVPGFTTVTYCQYGEARMKPTVLWGKHPSSWKPKPRCYNGDECHPRAPRGAKTGTQGIATARDRARVPIALSQEILEACLNA